VEGRARVRRLYEEHWRDAPEDPEPWGWQWRRALLLAEVRPGDRVLDLGCGAGRFLSLLDDAVGAEIAEAAAERARRHGEVVLIGDDGTLPLGHGEFDLVWCSEVIEHVPDALGLLQEARRVLKPAGRLVLTTPDHGLARRLALAALRFETHFDPLGQHVRFFTRSTLAATLRAAGFEPRIARRRGTLIARADRA
jgi:SAM-dependent methyltransferase